METTRQKKVSRLLEKEISNLFISDLRELTLGTLVSVTKVRITPDLGIARTYISIFPSEKADEVIAKVNDNLSNVRRLLGNKVGKQLRIVPGLQFYVDDSLDYIDNIDRLLKE